MDSNLQAADASSIQDHPEDYNERDALLPSSSERNRDDDNTFYHQVSGSDNESENPSPCHVYTGHTGQKKPCSDDNVKVIVKDKPSGETTPRRNYSVMRARVVSSLVLVFYAMSAPSMTVLSQYLRHRFLSEGHVNASDMINKTACGINNNSDPLVKQENDVESRVSILNMYLGYCSSLPAIFTSLILGSYSDVLGRRMILLSPLFGALVYMVMCFFIIRFDMDVNFLYIPKVLEGLSGGFYCILIAAFSITVDLDIGKSRRTIWIVLLEGLARVTMSSSSIATGILIKEFDYSVAILFLTGPVAVAFFLALFMMPETKPEVTERKKYNLCIHVKRIFSMYVSEGNPRDRKALFLALLIFFLVMFTSLYSSIATLYQMHEPFCWDSTIIGYYGAFSNVVQVIVGTIFFKALQALKFIRNDVIAMVSTLFQVGSCVMEALITTTWEFFLVPVVAAPFFVATGVLRGVMSYLVGPHNQGAMFASVAVMESISVTVSSTVMNQVYAATVSTLPGLVFLVIAGIGVVTFFMYFIFFHYYDDPTKRKSLQLQVTSPDGHVDEGSKDNDIP